MAVILVLLFGLPAPSGAVEPGRPTATGPARWAWPFDVVRLARGFVAPVDRYAPGHRGIDLVASAGDEVRAPSDATVRFVGKVVDRGVLTLDHGGGVLSSYEPVESELAAGDVVARGQLLARMAAGGHCGETCLHVGVRVDGVYVSPLLFFARVPPAVLLPLRR